MSQPPLDVDRFFHSLVIEPRKPLTYETTLADGRAEGELYLVNFENHLSNAQLDLSNYTSKEPAVRARASATSQQPSLTQRESDLSADVSKARRMSKEREARKNDYIYLVMRASSDAGRSWTEPWDMLDPAGERIQGNHQSVVRTRSGKLGLIYNDHRHFPNGHPTRDGGSGMMYRDSEDEGRTWSEPVVMYPHHAMTCAGHAIVLDSGRIVAPAYRWISHDPTGASEGDNHISFSFVLVSDDEGSSWQLSLSELFSYRHGACYSLGEPAVAAMTDGRLLMDLRSTHARRYQATSDDGGISWSQPQPLAGVASSSVPAILRPLPTGPLLMIWNQASRGEILKGLHRARLSCAVSDDDGATWRNFVNLESLDDETEIAPLPDDWFEVVEQQEDYWYWQPPSNAERYVRAPGPLRVCYPDARVVGDEVIVVYDYGWGTYGPSSNGTRLRAIPIDYLTGE